MDRERIALRHIDRIQPNSIIWDRIVTGFGIRRQRSDAVIYFCKYRTKSGRARWQAIGQHGQPKDESGALWNCDSARNRAREILGEVASGSDPASVRERHHAATVADLCDQYLEAAKAGRILTKSRRPKKASTLATDEGRIVRHIKPLLGDLPVPAVTTNDIESFMANVATGKTAARVKTKKKRGLAIVDGGMGTASRTVGLLGGMFTWAVKQGMRPDNPCTGVERPADGICDRRLTRDEYRLLGQVLRQCADERDEWWPPAVEAVWFIALTGWRKGEVVFLRWPEIDLGKRLAILGDSKTGQSVRPLSKPACDVLRRMRKYKRGADGLVFPGSREGTPLGGLGGTVEQICEQGGLPDDVTCNVLRHSFASEGGDLEYSDHTIGLIIGHRNLGANGRSITRKVYIHRADAVLLAAADRIASRIQSLMATRSKQTKKTKRETVSPGFQTRKTEKYLLEKRLA